MTDRPDIQRAGVGAAALFAALHARTFPKPWDAAAFATLLEGPASRGLLASIADAPVGFVVYVATDAEAEIITLGVDPTARRMGVARSLLAHAAFEARGAGAQALYLEVAETNIPARRLYAGQRFQDVGRRPAYYADGSAALTCRLCLREERR